MNHSSAGVNDATPLDFEGRITIRTWDVDVLRQYIKAWDILTDSEKLERIKLLSDEIAERTVETHNIALDGLLTYIVQGLNPLSSATTQASHLAIGTGTSTPEGSDTALDNEVYRTPVGDAQVDGLDLLTSTFISQAEGNGHVISEIGLAGGSAAADGPLLTRSLLDAGQEIDKNSSMVATIDYVLEVRRA